MLRYLMHNNFGIHQLTYGVSKATLYKRLYGRELYTLIDDLCVN